MSGFVVGGVIRTTTIFLGVGGNSYFFLRSWICEVRNIPVSRNLGPGAMPNWDLTLFVP